MHRWRTSQRSNVTSFCGLLAFTLLSACTVLSDVHLLSGFGKPCAQDSDCQNARCLPSPILAEAPNGICALPCMATAECPTPTTCTGGICQLPRRIGVTLPASVQSNKTSDLPTYLSVKSHIDGLGRAMKVLPYATLEQDFPAASGNAIDALRSLATRSDLVIGHDLSFLPNLNVLAREFPNHTFVNINHGIHYQFFAREPNLATVWVRREEAWYVAGRLAGTAAIRRVGVISTGISPESVRNVNAFVLGARRANPGVNVEVRYIGALGDFAALPSYDYRDKMGALVPPKLYREELLARQLADSGAEFIADMSGNQRAMNVVAATVNPARIQDSKKPIPVLVSGLSSGCLTATGQLESTTCIGAIYDNWEFVYRASIEAAHRSRLPAGAAIERAMSNTADTSVGVQINTMFSNALMLDALIGDFIDELVIKPADKRIFIGPMTPNGQRDADGDGIPDLLQSVASGQLLGDDELASMCFYLDGVVEPYDTGQRDAMMQPILAERSALVPGGLVPGATTADSESPLPIPGDKLALPSRESASCRKNAKWIYRSNG